LQRLDNPAFVIADSTFVVQVNAKIRQLLGEVGGIRIDDLPQE
jgi:hypothetical protein